MRSQLVRHPYLLAFVLLAIAMEGVLYFATRSASLQPSQYATIAAATLLTAAVAVWIITWER